MAPPPTIIIPPLNLVFQAGGSVQGLTAAPADNTVTDSKIPASANIDQLKLQYAIRKTSSQGGAVAVVSDRQVIHVVNGATGNLSSFKAGLRQANVGVATVTVDLLKNGITILTAPISLNNTVAAFASVTAAFASTGLVAGDVLEINAVATAGGGTLGEGLFALLNGYELPF